VLYVPNRFVVGCDIGVKKHDRAICAGIH
jgi:hypothetical protein